ncbi:MAG: MATE family efflux transporter [Dehalococcoidales bacterium]|nr:MAG: MATE family efflux transporter [Dehalococcoidales bacterium]
MGMTRDPEGRSDVMERDWTKGSIIGNLWSLSWPMTISSTIMILGPTIDMIWVGKLGAASIAGVGVSGIAVMSVNALIFGLFTGLRALVARFVGAGEAQEANHVSQQAFVIGIAFSIFTAVIGIFLAEPILLLLGLEADVVAEGAAYMRIMLIGMVTMSGGMLAQSVMQASGDAITPMQIGIATRIFHVALCPFLVFGWWVFPRLGVTGAALTGVISQGAGGAILLWALFSGRTRLRLTLRNFHFDGDIIWRMIKIGIPSSITMIQINLTNMILMWFIAPFGTLAVAAHSLVGRVDGFIQMPAMGLGQAAGVLAAQNLGAEQPDRAEKTGWISIVLYTAIMFVGSLVIWFWGRNVVGIFSSDPPLVEMSNAFLRIQIVQYMVFGPVIVLMTCLNGVGDTIVPMVNILVTMWGVQIPLAYFLPKITNLGVYGVRWGIVLAIAVRAIVYLVYFKLGRWKQKQV